jgi:hypothetical protein
MSTENASALAEGQSLPADTSQQTEVTSTENSEATPKTFTQAELDAIVQKRAAKEARKAEARYQELQREIAALKEPKPAEVKPEGKEPVRADFNSWEEFMEAKAEFKAEQKVKKHLEEFEGKNAKKDEESKRAKAQQEFQKRVDAVIELGQKSYPDFDAVINEAVEDGVIPVKGALYEAIMDSDVGEKLAYHLAKHPAEAERIQKLTVYGQLRELGKLEDKLSAKKEPRETMDPIGGRTSNSNGLSDSQSTDAWIKARNKQAATR